MEMTRVMDVDEERLLRHFCLEPECNQVKEWFKGQGYTRPEEFDGRLSLSQKLRESGNKKFQASDFTGAMMHALAALYCLDFSQARTVTQSDEEKRSALEALVPILSNLSIVFLKRGDAYNSGRAADLGLDRASRLPPSERVEQLRAKLLFRRGLAKGQTKDFTEARSDLREAARLMPDDREVRRALERCKALAQGQQGNMDDPWRGLLSETPKTARCRARVGRCWRSLRQGAHEVSAALRRPDGLKVAAYFALAPVLCVVLPMLTGRLAEHFARPPPTH